MATIKESFVGFETAVLLKEKGFDERLDTVYSEYGELHRIFDKDFYESTNSFITITNSNYNDVIKYKYDFFVTAPTLQMARQWLDETYDVRIFILPARDTDNYMCHVYIVWKINKSSGDFEEVYMSGSYEDYDKCMEGAIDYCLENLI